MLSLQPLYLERSLINSVVNKARQSRSGDSVSCKWGGELIDLIKERDLKAKAKINMESSEFVNQWDTKKRQVSSLTN